MKGKLAISVSKDTMLATVSIVPDNVIEVTEEYILKELKDFGIKVGIDRNVVAAMLHEGEYYNIYCGSWKKCG